VTDIGRDAFAGCVAVRSITIPMRFKDRITEIFDSSDNAEIKYI